MTKRKNDSNPRSDSNTSINQLKNDVKQFCDDRDWDQFHNIKDLALALSIEASELLEIFRWKEEKDLEKLLSKPEKRTHIEEELADILYFVLRIAQKNDIDLSQALAAKIIKNAANYPIEKSKGSNKKYTEL